MFAVRCRDSVGNTNTADAYISFSVTAPVDGGDFTKPAPPPNFRVNVITEAELDLSWAASYDNEAVARYRLFRCSSGYCTPTDLVSSPTTTAYRDAGLSPRTRYRYQVTAVDTRGNESPRSRLVSATTTLETVEEAPSPAVSQAQEPAAPRTITARPATSTTPRTPEESANLLLRQIQALIKHLTRLLAQYAALIQNGK